MLSALAKRLLGVALANKAAGKEISDALDATANMSQATSTAAALSVTATEHSGKTVVLDSTHTQTITLPASTGGGAEYTFVVGSTGTDGSKVIKVANATDVMAGVSLVAQSDATLVGGFFTSATSDTITLNNTTMGGFIGDRVEIKDIKAGVFEVKVFAKATGAVATPFSAGVP
jgi:hypothetical protein